VKERIWRESWAT